MRIKDAVYVYKLVGGDKLAWHGRYHAHESQDYEVHLFLEGHGAFLLNRSQYIIEGNRLFLTKPREFHSILPGAVKRSLSYYAILFEPDPDNSADRELISLLNDPHSGGNRAITIEGRERFLIEELYHLAADKAHDRAAEYLLLSLLYRWYGKGAPGEAETRREHPDKGNHVERALILMERSLREKLSIDRLAGRLGLSEEHFIRLFHRRLGMSPLQYFTRLRIEAASSFLVDTRLTISAVADHFGFENPFHFSRIFKKCTGLSPLEYRRVFTRPEPEYTAM
ncbi:MAG: AraC family transcriptional regulator [Treponema sp.]|jgi:AraC-like DNA-binding protein|nr:AraC family transcriptional regulator [Treponema sp.]